MARHSDHCKGLHIGGSSSWLQLLLDHSIWMASLLELHELFESPMDPKTQGIPAIVVSFAVISPIF